MRLLRERRKSHSWMLLFECSECGSVPFRIRRRFAFFLRLRSHSNITANITPSSPQSGSISSAISIFPISQTDRLNCLHYSESRWPANLSQPISLFSLEFELKLLSLHHQHFRHHPIHQPERGYLQLT